MSEPVHTPTETMTWMQLLRKKRYGDAPGKERYEPEGRSAFDTDYDRVVFSAPFRRLQDKTQVIPLPEHDFVHTRLTHSLEVSCVGRSLGKRIGLALLKKHPELADAGYNIYDFGAIIATAALAHDIGNPPFGHSGEKAISEYFKFGRGTRFEAVIDDEAKWADLIAFEGNANGFRTLVNPGSGTPGGLRLTYPILAAFTKYPKTALPKYPKGRASEKKYGFFESEKDFYKDVAESLGLLQYRKDGAYAWCRHPLALLVEAADDICYSIIDFEDGLRLGLIDEHYAADMLFPILGEGFDRSRYEAQATFRDKLSYLRSVVIGVLIESAAKVFLENEAGILSGAYDRSLMDDTPHFEAVEEIKRLTLKKVYRSRKVLEIEGAGFTVIAGLLEHFITAANDEVNKKGSWQSKKVMDLLPEAYKGASGKMPEDLYERILLICDFISGMTDTGAIALYKKLNGIELPKG